MLKLGHVAQLGEHVSHDCDDGVGAALAFGAVGVSVLFSLVGGAALSVIGIIFAKNFLGLVSCPDELLEDAALYFRLYFAGLPILMLFNFSAAILRASGDSKRPMVFIIVGGITKLCFRLTFKLRLSDLY